VALLGRLNFQFKKAYYSKVSLFYYLKSMNISFIPKFFLNYFSSKYAIQNEINILLSHIILILVFILLKNQVIEVVDKIPHFCLFNRIVGIDCPFCGITRGFCEISTGNFSAAKKLNPFSLVIGFYICLQIPLRTFILLNSSVKKPIELFFTFLQWSMLISIFFWWFLKQY
jgi:hypothetical protein